MVGTKDGCNATHGGRVLRADVGIRPYGFYPTLVQDCRARPCFRRVRVLRGVEGAAPYGVYRGWYKIVGTTIGRPQRDGEPVPYNLYPTSVRDCRARPCSRRVRVLRGVEGAAPYGFYRGWYEIVGTTIGRPFIIAYGDAGRETRPLRGLSDVIVNL